MMTLTHLIHLCLPELPHIRDPVDTVAADEDSHDDQADVGKPHVLLVDPCARSVLGRVKRGQLQNMIDKSI